MNEHCVLMALPCGRDERDLVQQANNLKLHFISYLLNKGAAGIINVNAPNTQQVCLNEIFSVIFITFCSVKLMNKLTNISTKII